MEDVVEVGGGGWKEEEDGGGQKDGINIPHVLTNVGPFTLLA